ncbi:transposable element Tcb1 transposase [Trichonephila clavipes]|uniref:Transposable element Tcb1 transposase n=1 Tax=Trichonephila clavipes TaxID=2585209 RepID=A0A8X6VC79_TRICX|nr:transposable element Tcb1 transposase [Trichonephila clavipes]
MIMRQNHISIKTIQRELHAANIRGRVAIPKPLLYAWNAMERLQGTQTLQGTQLQWEQVIWSDESSLTVFQITERVFVCRTQAEAFHVDCMIQTVKQGESFENTSVHTSHCGQTWLHGHDDEVEYLTLCSQSPELNINEC